MKEVFIVSAKRTPIGGLLGSLSEYSATQLGAITIQNTYESISLNPEWIDSVYMGNVLSALVNHLQDNLQYFQKFPTLKMPQLSIKYAHLG